MSFNVTLPSQGLIGMGQSSSHNSLILEEHSNMRIFKQILVNKRVLGKPAVCSCEMWTNSLNDEIIYLDTLDF